MNDIRIAIIDPVGKKAGLDSYDLNLANAFNSKGFQTMIVSNFRNDSELVVNHFDFHFRKGRIHIPRLIYQFIKALRKAKKTKIKFIILHVFHSSVLDYIFIWLTKKMNFKASIILHDAESLIKRKRKSYLKKCIQLSENVFVHNSFVHSKLSEMIESKELTKIKIIPHGNYLDLPNEVSKIKVYQHFNLEAEKKYILFFGMIKKSKGLEVLINAMVNVSDNVHLIIAGRTRDVDFNMYVSMIEKLNLSNRIHGFIRYISNEERNMLFSISDICVLPYHQIYQSGVMIMAMSYGVPVIVSDLSPNQTIINNMNGVPFKEGDSKELAIKISSLLSDPEQMKKIALNAKQHVSLHHSWDKIADEIIDAIN
jgi:glycosyltransferase involved in cell wall biosynthesis